MTTAYSYIETNTPAVITATSIMTDENEHEVRCGMCAREIYVDEPSYRLYSEALISGLDNPFRCELCAEE